MSQGAYQGSSLGRPFTPAHMQPLSLHHCLHQHPTTGSRSRALGMRKKREFIEKVQCSLSWALFLEPLRIPAVPCSSSSRSYRNDARCSGHEFLPICSLNAPALERYRSFVVNLLSGVTHAPPWGSPLCQNTLKCKGVAQRMPAMEQVALVHGVQQLIVLTYDCLT